LKNPKSDKQIIYYNNSISREILGGDFMEELQEVIQKYNNEHLLEQYIDHQEEYTPEALKLLKHEIDKRDIQQEEIDAYLKLKEANPDDQKPLDTKDFVPFEHSFSHTDILLAVAVLRDSKVIFFVDNPGFTDTIPLESEAVKKYSIHVHKDYIEKTHELLDEHFVKEDGIYSFKHAGAIERLKSFSFHDLHLSELEAAETIEVDLTSDERKVIIQYGKRLLDEVDKIEEVQERVVFYYDSVDSLIGYLAEEENKLLSRSDLLAILEILQIYCQNTDFPSSMNDSIATLLGFFLDA
jgi:hypothetical protein